MLSLLSFRYFFDVLLLVLASLLQVLAAWALLATPLARGSRTARRFIVGGTATSILILVFGFLLVFDRVARHFPATWQGWFRGLIMVWAFLSMLLLAAYAVCRWVLPNKAAHSRGRRNFLRAARAALFATPAVAAGYGMFVQRLNLRLREVEIPVPGLAQDLDGLKMVQLTDIHLSPFLSESELARAVDMANETRAHIALVTGDLITTKGDPLDACLRQLGRLRADAGVLGCLGNHEVYALAEDYTTAEAARLGIRFLRGAATPLKFGDAVLNIAGVDYQRFSNPYLVGAGRLVQPGALNLLLSHNPDVFPVAANQGYQVTIAGHTHGGQVRVEILSHDVNVARFYTRFVDGLYQSGGSSVFVSRGIGTIGMPVRLGAPPEVALIRLRRA